MSWFFNMYDSNMHGERVKTGVCLFYLNFLFIFMLFLYLWYSTVTVVRNVIDKNTSFMTFFVRHSIYVKLELVY
jgi:TM2 domain-containing membrane protein YozV